MTTSSEEILNLSNQFSSPSGSQNGKATMTDTERSSYNQSSLSKRQIPTSLPAFLNEVITTKSYLGAYRRFTESYQDLSQLE